MQLRREQNDERISTFQLPDDQLGSQPDGQPARQLASQAGYYAKLVVWTVQAPWKSQQ